MSNILIIKHGSLGDIVQISGVLRDIREAHNDKKIFILTTIPYVELLSRCPYLDGVLMDRRLPRWNIFYLIKLRKILSKFNFSHVYDLQNSSRTSFYRKYLLNISNWSSTETVLKRGERKKDFDSEPVLERFKFQLDNSNIKTQYSLNPDFTWASVNIDKIINKYFGKKFVLIFPFCSPQLSHKKWPYYNKLIKIIKSKHINLEIAIAPGQNEIEEAKKIETVIITSNEPNSFKQFLESNNIKLKYVYGDATVLKTIIRSNPGFFLMRHGYVRGKWHFNNIPTGQEVLDAIGIKT